MGSVDAKKAQWGGGGAARTPDPRGRSRNGTRHDERNCFGAGLEGGGGPAAGMLSEAEKGQKTSQQEALVWVQEEMGRAGSALRVQLQRDI